MLLELQGVSKVFGGLVALSDVSLGVERGSITALIGPNGAGKTTCFNLISGVYRPTAGRILFRGESIDGLRPDQIAARGIGRTFQIPQPFGDMTVLENVMMGCHCRTRSGFLATSLGLPSARLEDQAVREKAMGMLEFVGLADRAHHLVGSLPLGQERLMEIARALASDPDLLLLDESASGLSTKETEGLADLIQRTRSQGVTVLLVEHNMHLVMDISDHVIVLNYGQALFAGPPQAVQQDPGVIRAYLGERAVAM